MAKSRTRRQGPGTKNRTPIQTLLAGARGTEREKAKADGRQQTRAPQVLEKLPREANRSDRQKNKQKLRLGDHD